MTAYPGRTFGQLYHRLLKGNGLVDGTFDVGGRTLSVADITAPVLVFGGANDGIAPLGAVKAAVPLLTGSREARFEIVPGGHLGMLTGREARTSTWLVLDAWVDEWSARRDQQDRTAACGHEGHREEDPGQEDPCQEDSGQEDGCEEDGCEEIAAKKTVAKKVPAKKVPANSVVSLVVSASSSATRPSRRAIRCSGVSSTPSGNGAGCWGLSGLRVIVPSAAVFLPVPNWSSQWRRVPRSTPRSSAMPRTVAPGVDSYKSTAWRRNSSE